MRPLLLLRPEPGWTVSAKTARDMGMEVVGAPLFDIETVAWDPPEREQFDGLLIGSANAFRHAGDSLKRYAKLPVHVVGQATADAARSAGLMVGQVGKGGLQSVLDRLAGRKLRLLRLAGEDRVPLTAPEGLRVETRVVYRAVPQSLELPKPLLRGTVVALHSGAAAERFAQECDRLKVDRSKFIVVAIGSRVAEMVGEGWASVHVAWTPDDGAMLALAKSLCQESSDGDG